MDEATYSQIVDGQHDIDAPFLARLAIELADIAHGHDLPVGVDVILKIRDGEHGMRKRKSNDLSILFDGECRYPDGVEIMLHGSVAGGPGSYLLSIDVNTERSHFVYATGDRALAHDAFQAMVEALEGRRRRRLVQPEESVPGGTIRRPPVRLAIAGGAALLAMVMPILSNSPWNMVALILLGGVVVAAIVPTLMQGGETPDKDVDPESAKPRSVIDLGDADTAEQDVPRLEYQPTVPLDLDKT